MQEKVKSVSDTVNELCVAVMMQTYNHGSFIKQAIEGVIKQQTEFIYRLFIIDDCSTDDTYRICKNYADDFPDIVYLIRNETNLGAYKTGKRLRSICANVPCKYFAICEGDDYWTDESKLQKQVEFLEANLGFAVCWTQATYENVSTGSRYVPESFNVPILLSPFYEVKLENYYDKFAAPTLTAVFQAAVLKKITFEEPRFCNDNVLFLVALSLGRGALLNFNSAVYRIHDGGIWTGANSISKKLSFFYAIDTAMSIAPSLTEYDHLQSWRKWNITQAFYLMADSYSIKDFKQFSSLLLKVLQYQDKVERRKVIKKYFKIIYKRKWKAVRLSR